MIAYGRQDITEEDINAVVKVLRSDFLTQGPTVPAFESKLCEYTGAKYSIAVNSCTSALHIACLALGLGPGDILWTSPITFVASANCALYCGASVDFVDIDPDTALMSVSELEYKLKQAEIDGSLPKIVVPVHFAGQSCDMKEIYKLGKKYGFSIIEDAAHAIGARYRGESVGNCLYSDITVFSFHPVKIITTGEGGCALTNSTELAEKMTMLRSHGITREHNKMQNKSDGPWYYEQIKLGFNYRMTDIQAALGISQLQRVDKFISRRHVLKKRYDYLLDNLPLIKPYQEEYNYSAFHLYPVQIDLKKTQKNRLYVFKELNKCGVGVNVHYIPVHMQPYYQKLGFKFGNFINSENYYMNTISLPLHFGITYKEQDKITKSIEHVFNT